MNTLRYLAYGSNLLPQRLQNRVPSARVIDTVGLMGWQLKFHKRGQDASAKCNIVQTGKTSDVVYGAVYEMLASEKPQLDKAEGLNNGYGLVHIEIPGLGRVFFYQAEDGHIDDRLLPFDWYKALVIAGSRHHAFPQSYLVKIDHIKAMADVNEIRHYQHMAIVDSL